MDRQYELRNYLPKDDWKQYEKGIPLYSREGDYLGRDVADPKGFSWKMTFLTVGLGSLIIFHPMIGEDNKIVGLLATLGAAAAPSIYDRVNFMLQRKDKILNPLI